MNLYLGNQKVCKKKLQKFTQHMNLYLGNQNVWKKLPEIHETYDPVGR